MLKKISIVLFAILCLTVGLYPAIYLFVDRKFGLLQTKTAELLSDNFWNIAFYTHITLGGVAIFIGWTQFVRKWRKRYLNLHRQVGKIYVVAALTSAIAGMYIALFSTAGIIPSIGFECLAIVWFLTTFFAYRYIRNLQIIQHQKMMIYSYAACFAAVTLRIYLPILVSLFHDFNKAYSLVAWLCWVPNLIVAYFLGRNISLDDETMYTLRPSLKNKEPIS